MRDASRTPSSSFLGLSVEIADTSVPAGTPPLLPILSTLKIRLFAIPLLLVALQLAITGSASAGPKIDGQVFIVTGGHESVKLGLVPVVAFKPEEFEQSISNTREHIDAERPKIKEIRSQADQLEKVIEKFKDQINRSDWNEVRTSTDLPFKAYDLVGHVGRCLRYLDSAAPFFNSLPKPIAKTKTDADGKFKLELPSSDEVILAATATREVPKNKENYFWATRVKPPSSVTLSNDNLTDAASDQSALQTKSLSGSPNPNDSAEILLAELEELKTATANFSQKFKSHVAGAAASEPSPVPLGRPQFVTLLQPVTIQIQYGNVTLPSGSRVQFVSTEGADIRIRYAGTDALIPSSAASVQP